MTDDKGNRETLIAHFMKDYLPRREVAYRLPMSEPIQTFWPALLEHRQKNAIVLPLYSDKGQPYWYVPTQTLLASGDKVSAMARSEAAASLPQYQALFIDGLIDEAYFSSVIEGASTERLYAKEFLKSGAEPKDNSERMIYSNYRALSHVLAHLDAPITHELIQEIAGLLTDGTAESGQKGGYRDVGVQIVSGRQEIVYVAPDAGAVQPMMDQLLCFIANEDIHPVLKACVAHVYFVTVHPLFDGNGRTARALSYMVLLRSGYDFFRQFPISGMIAQERPRYYKALQDVQSPENGLDMTYFLEYYAGMLARSVDALNQQVSTWHRIKETLDRLSQQTALPQRINDGIRWLLSSESKTITAEVWKKKWNISFETARQDMVFLESEGVLTKHVRGRKFIYEIRG